MLPVARSLGEIGMFSAVDLFSNYAGTRTDLAPWLADAVINRDRNLRLQYLAGMGLNLYQSEAIYADMLQYSRYPDDLFVGVDATKQRSARRSCGCRGSSQRRMGLRVQAE